MEINQELKLLISLRKVEIFWPTDQLKKIDALENLLLIYKNVLFINIIKLHFLLKNLKYHYYFLNRTIQIY